LRSETSFNIPKADWCATPVSADGKACSSDGVSPLLRRAIGPKTDASDLEQVARKEGMTTMTDDGVAKTRAGLTTIDGVFRVSASL
jgi:hypothetical protein